MIAYHYPPQHGSSGLQRTISFVNDLPDEGWEPIVLSAHPMAYSECSDGQLGDIRAGTKVYRAFGLDTKKHLSIKQRYLSSMALPDRWVSWWLGAVPTALWLIRKYRPQVIWSTYPIATAHLIGESLHKITGLPWVADFRDSMTEPGYPDSESVYNSYVRIERSAVANCSRVVFTTPGAVKLYAERYPQVPEQRWSLIANGYNENIFREIEGSGVSLAKQSKHPLKIVHSGILYPNERDPRVFFAALSELKKDKLIDCNQVNIVLRATGHDGIFEPMLRDYGIDDIVFLAPSISYRDALIEQLSVDGLILFQAANCNHQIPAKLYEYLRTRKPILALTDPLGDTAGVLKESGVSEITPLDDKAGIIDAMKKFLQRLSNDTVTQPTDGFVEKYSRRVSAKHLGRLLDQITSV